MSSRQPSAWRPLPGVEVPGIPGLLVSAHFTAQSYTIILTDLANVWTESLDKKPIIMRGLKEDTSIDPTDGPDQIRKLLDLIRAAFDPSAPEHGDTTLSLSKSVDTDGEGNLEIHVSVILPKPLRPLKWPIYLRKGPQSAIATELVLPLVHAYQARAREVDELIAALREKDGVMTKLVDKLEASGIGLENVFTALSGRRKVTRVIAEERIKGLASFKESEFRKHAETVEREGDDNDMLALLDSVFGGGPGLPSGSAMEIGDSPALNDWWTKLGKGKTSALVSRGKDRGSAPPSKANSRAAAAPATRAEPVEDDEETASEDDHDFEAQPSPPAKKGGYNRKSSAAQEDDEDDDFQVQSTPPPRGGHNTRASQSRNDDDDEDKDFEVQATPPGRKRDGRHGQATRILADDDDETTGGEEAEIPDSMPSAATKDTGSKGTGSRRLGAIGGKKKQPPPKEKTTPPPPPAASPTPSPSPPHTRAHPAAAADDDSATASDPDDSSPPPPPPPKSSQPTRRTGGRIGQIGGRKPAAKETTPEPRSSTAAAASQQTQTPRRRLGVIGKKAPDSGGGGRGR
ncbi:XLF-domain-containing protein, partial [Coniochaeta hoffmannii]